MFRLPTIFISSLRQSSVPVQSYLTQQLQLPTTIARHISPYSTCTGLSAKDVREVQIPVPWGHISGKWWGPDNVQPLLCLHGWQDNSGTWDRLAPLLPSDISLLAIDLPGHGLSSHYHPGRSYHFLEYVTCIRRILRHYNWEKASFLTHSLGSIVSFVFSAIYPEMVHNYVGIDAMKPFASKPMASVLKGGKAIDKHLKVHDFDHNKSPTYTYNEARDRLVKGTNNSITEEVSGFLLARGLKEVADGRFQYTRDSRLKVDQMMFWTQGAILELASNVKCNVCQIVADPGLVYDTPEHHKEASDIVKKAANSYEYHKVPGTHHVHLTEPEKIAPIVIKFLQANSDRC